jgi:periplasmic protein TonB
VSTPSESTTYLSIPPAEAEPTPPAPPQPEQAHPEAATPTGTDPGPSTAVLEPVAPPPTIPALPLAPRDPADRPFAAPQRSAPGKPDALWRRLFRRG